MNTPQSNEQIVIALPKGRLTDESLALLARAGVPVPADFGRRLIVDSEDGALRYLLAKPIDVPTYVEYGAADLGICGLDVLRESQRNVYEPLLLPFGHCRLSLAGPANRSDTPLRYESQPARGLQVPAPCCRFLSRAGRQCRNHRIGWLR